MLNHLLPLSLWPLHRSVSNFKLSDGKEELYLSIVHYKSPSLTQVQIIVLYVMFVSYYWIENRSSCHISEPILCEPPYEVFYRPHLSLTATCRQVSGSPSSRWIVLDCGLPRHALNPVETLTTLSSSSWTPVPLSIWPHWTHALCFPWGPAYVPYWTDPFFFF